MICSKRTGEILLAAMYGYAFKTKKEEKDGFVLNREKSWKNFREKKENDIFYIKLSSYWSIELERLWLEHLSFSDREICLNHSFASHPLYTHTPSCPFLYTNLVHICKKPENEGENDDKSCEV